MDTLSGDKVTDAAAPVVDGTDLRTIQLLMGHTHLEDTTVYLHLSQRHLHAAPNPPEDAQGLEHARPSQLNEIEISPSGFGLHFPAVDADLYVPDLLEGFLGSKSWMASRSGQIGRWYIAMQVE